MTRYPISKKPFSTILNLALFLFFSLANKTGFSQGRVLINEYLSWTANGCSVTSEYVELFNFGPGPVDIGCYVLTDGDFSITMPANTTIQPGQFFVIAGQNTLPLGCANGNQAVAVNLNWNTCNCTSAPIPTTGDGLMTDGGSGSEQLVLFDPSFRVVDAIVRVLSETSSPVITSTVGGQCVSKTFDLDTMNIQYEMVGESQGRANSFARRVDGGCGWLKDPQQSGGATNNTPGSRSTLDASLSITTPSTCTNNGAATVSVHSGNYNEIFPVNFILAKDVDSNGVYSIADSYSSGVDSSSNTVSINHLSPGIYKVVIETSKGCDLTPFNFNILDCRSVLLEIPITFFELVSLDDGSLRLKWNVGERQHLSSFIVQKSPDGINFSDVAEIKDIGRQDFASSFYFQDRRSPAPVYYRLVSIHKQGTRTHSTVLKNTPNSTQLESNTIVFPNPFRNTLTVSFNAPSTELMTFRIYDILGKFVSGEKLAARKGINRIQLSTIQLPPGVYIIQWANSSNTIVHRERIIKASK